MPLFSVADGAKRLCTSVAWKISDVKKQAYRLDNLQKKSWTDSAWVGGCKAFIWLSPTHSSDGAHTMHIETREMP